MNWSTAIIALTIDRGRKPVETEEAVRAEFEEFDAYFMLEDGRVRLPAAGARVSPTPSDGSREIWTGKHLKATEELKRSQALDTMLALPPGPPGTGRSTGRRPTTRSRPGRRDPWICSLFGFSKIQTGCRQPAGDDV